MSISIECLTVVTSLPTAINNVNAFSKPFLISVTDCSTFVVAGIIRLIPVVRIVNQLKTLVLKMSYEITMYTFTP